MRESKKNKHHDHVELYHFIEPKVVEIDGKNYIQGKNIKMVSVKTMTHSSYDYPKYKDFYVGLTTFKKSKLRGM